MKRTASALIFAFLVTALSWAADTYSSGKIVKWENSTYAEKKKSENWIVYQLQTNTTTYSIARHKETKPQMQAGENIQYELKGKTDVKVIDASGKKREYQIVGQTAAPSPTP